jgi:hypothetical protein
MNHLIIFFSAFRRRIHDIAIVAPYRSAAEEHGL